MKRTAVAILAVALMATAASAANLYEESFAGGTGGDLSGVGYNCVYTGAGTVAYSSAPQPNASWNANGGYDGAAGFANAFWGVNGDNNDPNDGTSMTPDADQILAIYTDSEISVADVSDIDAVSFYHRNNSGGQEANTYFSVIIKAGGSWYIADDSTNTGSGWSTSAYSLDTTTATWKALNLVSGSALSIGAAATPSGAVTGVGVFIDVTAAGDNTVNPCIDQLTVTPEPTTMALVGLGGLALLRRRRK